MKISLGVVLRRLILALFAIWSLFPIYWMLTMSLKRDVDAVASVPTFLFVPTFQNYVAVLTASPVLSFLVNSVIVAVGATAIGLAVGVPVAYVLARHQFRGRKDYDLWILSTRMTPPVAMLIPFFLMYSRLGLKDTHLGLMIVHVGLNLATIIWVMKGFFMEVPIEIEEAALLDGNSYWGAFLRIILPLSLPGVVAVAILAFLFSWNEFLFAVVLTDTRVRTAPVGLYTFIGYQEIRWAELCASAMILLIPVLLFVLFFQRQLVRGLTFGAVRE